MTESNWHNMGSNTQVNRHLMWDVAILHKYCVAMNIERLVENSLQEYGSSTSVSRNIYKKDDIYGRWSCEIFFSSSSIFVVKSLKWLAWSAFNLFRLLSRVETSNVASSGSNARAGCLVGTFDLVVELRIGCIPAIEIIRRYGSRRVAHLPPCTWSSVVHNYCMPSFHSTSLSPMHLAATHNYDLLIDNFCKPA